MEQIYARQINDSLFTSVTLNEGESEHHHSVPSYIIVGL